MKKTKEILSIENFTPENVDVTWIQEVSEKIPAEGNIDINIAEELAATFLRAADTCSDLLVKAAKLKGYKEATMKSEKSLAVGRLEKTGVTAAKAQELKREGDSLYVAAVNACTDAKALELWLQNKYDNLIRAHHYCKDLLRRYAKGEQIGDFNQGSKRGQFGEQEW